MNRYFSGLWRHADFRKLWAGQTISLVGSQVTALALPVAAALTLRASAFQMGLLGVASALPTLLFGLLAGVWVDRFRRLPLLIGADLGRALLLGSIPVAAFVGLLSMGQLYIVAFLAGVLTLLFNIANMSLLPSLVEREQLVEGNSKLELSRSGAVIVGPGVAGLLIQWITAPFAIVVDALSFLGSAAFLARIRVPEAVPNKKPLSLGSDLKVGVQTIVQHPILRSFITSLAAFNFFSYMIRALYVLYVIRALGISPAVLGLIYAVGSVGFLIGAFFASAVAQRLGTGPTIIWGAGVSNAAYLLIVVANGSVLSIALVLIAAQFIVSFASAITAINQQSMRQAVTPGEIQGRVHGATFFLASGLGTIGALIAGILGQNIGLHSTLVIATIGIQLGTIILLVTPFRKFRELSPVPPTAS
ncbi:MAG: MFS transporter [Ktedonobacteraceae bacterium]